MRKLFVLILLSGSLFAANLTFAQTIQTGVRGADCAGSQPSSGLCNPIQVNGVDDVKTFVKYTLGYVGGLLGFIAVITIVYGGIRMVTANGNDKTISEAKQTITYAIIGFVLAVLAYAGIVAVENLIGVQSTTSPANGVIFNPFGTGDLKTLVSSILRNVMGITGIIAVLMLVYNGFRYATSRGDEHQVSSAKKGIYWALIGLIIILFAYVIIAAIAKLIS